MNGWRTRRCYQLLGGLLATLAVAASSGCTVIRNEFRTLIAEPLKYGDNVDVVRTAKLNKEIAKDAFAQLYADQTEWPPSPDFRDGFIEGYADYLTFGGTGAPPVVPPRKYWNLPDRDPAGQNAVQDWFAGFAAGASEAKLSGLRELQTVPSSYLPADSGYSAGLEFEQEAAPHINETWEFLPAPEGSPPADEAAPESETRELLPLPLVPPAIHGMQQRSNPPSVAATKPDTAVFDSRSDTRSTQLASDASEGPQLLHDGFAFVVQPAAHEVREENDLAVRTTEAFPNQLRNADAERLGPTTKTALPRNVLRQSSRANSNVGSHSVKLADEAVGKAASTTAIEQ